jgi:hypothetical protein
VRAPALNLLFAATIADEKLLGVSTVSEYRLLEQQQGDHPKKEE